MYSGYVFSCNSAEQAQCLRSKMFTCVGEDAKSAGEIRVGSLIFLYNDETDSLLGPFTALSEGAETLDAGAWRGDIDDDSASQNVKLEWESLHSLAKASEQLPFLKEWKSCALTTTQIQRSLDLLNDAPLFIEARK